MPGMTLFERFNSLLLPRHTDERRDPDISQLS